MVENRADSAAVLTSVQTPDATPLIPITTGYEHRVACSIALVVLLVVLEYIKQHTMPG